MPEIAAEHAALREFLHFVVRESCWEGLDIDGATVQEKAVELGLLVPCGKDCPEKARHGCECGQAGEGHLLAWADFGTGSE